MFVRKGKLGPVGRRNSGYVYVRIIFVSGFWLGRGLPISVGTVSGSCRASSQIVCSGSRVFIGNPEVLEIGDFVGPEAAAGRRSGKEGVKIGRENFEKGGC